MTVESTNRPGQPVKHRPAPRNWSALAAGRCRYAATIAGRQTAASRLAQLRNLAATLQDWSTSKSGRLTTASTQALLMLNIGLLGLSGGTSVRASFASLPAVSRTETPACPICALLLVLGRNQLCHFERMNTLPPV